MSFASSRSSAGPTAYEHVPGEAAPDALRQQLPPWLVSFATHLAIMLACLLIASPVRNATSNGITTVFEPTNTEIDQYKFDATVQDEIGNGGTENLLSPTQAAAAHSGMNVQQEMKDHIDEKMLSVSEPTAGILSYGDSELVENIGTGAGGETQNTGGVAGSIDRITFEIAASIKERRTLAIWLFDASGSMKERREAIADRFENIYKQLGVLNVGADKALKTAVASFGESLHYMTEDPVDDVKDVVRSVRSIKDDMSGKENTFSAVMAVAQRWLSYRQKQNRNVMIIVVTDERGDDYQNLEQNIQLLRRYGIKVYVVGNGAVFGREKGFVTWKYEDGGTEDIPVDQGPETVAAERVELPFWGAQARDLDFTASGYGPYALTRLCAETGGLYLLTEESRIKFDPATMRNYRPDYRPIRVYQENLRKNMAKGALVAAAEASKVKALPTPQLVFRADTDNAVRNEVTEAQKPLAEIDYRVNELVTILSQGEKDRDKLDSPRWKASYDLAMGRALAMRVRTFGYNKMLAEMKLAPKVFETKGNNQWRLTPSTEITSGPDVKKLEKRATEYLTRVIDEHAGTPWAMLAERELSTPMGWEWKEASSDYARLDREAAERRTIQLAEEEQRKKMGKKTPAPPPRPKVKL